MVQGTGKFVRYSEKFEIGKFELRKARQCSWGKFQGTEHFVQHREIFEIDGSRDRESPLYFQKRLSLSYNIIPKLLSLLHFIYVPNEITNF